MNFTHKQLCQIGAKWLKNSCPEKFPVVFTELVTSAMETPDVIGFNSCRSCLIEVKTSRSDFYADKKKFFRIYPEQGMGNFRYYLCPENILKPEDVPEKWGLIWVSEKGRCKVIKQAVIGNCGSQDNWFEVNLIAERNLLYSALRRLND